MLKNCKSAMLQKIPRSLELQNSSLPRSLSKVQTTFSIPERKKPGNVQGQKFQWKYVWNLPYVLQIQILETISLEFFQ